MGKPVRIGKVSGDVYGFALMVDFLAELNLLPEEAYKNLLDIGGREGVHAALFRGLYAKSADVADLQDGNDPELSKN